MSKVMRSSRGLKILVLAAGVVWSGAAFAQPQNVWDKISSSGEVSCGLISNFPPLSWKVPGPAEYEGYLVNICRAVAEGLSRDMKKFIAPKYVETTWATIILDIQSGRIDLGAGMSVTEERQKALDMPGPIYALSDAVVYRKGSTVLPKWEDYNNASVKVASTTGTSTEKTALERMPKATHLSFKQQNEVILAVQSGRADIMVASFVTAMTAMKEGKSAFGGIVLLEPRVEQPSSFGIRKDGDGRFNNFLQKWGDEARTSGRVTWLIYDSLIKSGFDIKALSGSGL